MTLTPSQHKTEFCVISSPLYFFNDSSDYTVSIISKRLQDPASKGGFPL